jgi:hypothetical protein
MPNQASAGTRKKTFMMGWGMAEWMLLKVLRVGRPKSNRNLAALFGLLFKIHRSRAHRSNSEGGFAGSKIHQVPAGFLLDPQKVSEILGNSVPAESRVRP